MMRSLFMFGGMSRTVLRIGALLTVCAAAASVGAFAAPALKSREYKLALAPTKFAGRAPSDNLSELWERIVKPVINDLDPRSSGKSRVKNSFENSENRRVVFRDTKKCELAAAGFALRERAMLNDGKLADDAELTLKFRAPDEFIAASVNLEGGDDTKLEEDIVAFRTANNDVSIRSLYSRSVNQDVDRSKMPESVRGVIKRYPGLEQELANAGVAESILDAALVKGRPIHEVVLKGAVVDLGEKTDAKLALTIWYSSEAPPPAAPLAAELSYKYKTDKGNVSGPVARRALLLFRGLQDHLKDWASSDHETKTALGLPACE